MGSSADFVQLRWMQHALSEQVEFRPPIHMPLNQFQAVDLPLGLSVAPSHVERCSDRRLIFLKTTCEPFERGAVAVERRM